MDSYKELYWCDSCSSNKLDIKNDKEYKSFFSCYTTQQYSKHLKTNKHLENIKIIEEDSDSILCKYCNKKFSKVGYEVHKTRNKNWWRLGNIGNISCNNFIKGKQRVTSFNELTKKKEKQQRTKVGSFSPITQSYRPPNGYNKEEENPLIVCRYCNGALFTSQYDTKFLTQHETFICNCSDEKQLEQEKQYEKKEKEKLSWGTKGDIIPSTDAEVDYTQKPYFEDNCPICYLPINLEEYNYSIKILDKWNINTCGCTDIDTE